MKVSLQSVIIIPSYLFSRLFCIWRQYAWHGHTHANGMKQLRLF